MNCRDICWGLLKKQLKGRKAESGKVYRRGLGCLLSSRIMWEMCVQVYKRVQCFWVRKDRTDGLDGATELIPDCFHLFPITRV